MKAYQKRAVVEKNELNEKIEKLETFVDGEIASELSEEEQDCLSEQLSAMMEYSTALQNRINLWGIDENEEVTE